MARTSSTTVRAAQGRFSALSVFLSKSVFYGAFVWARRVLNSQKRRFPARAVAAPGDAVVHSALTVRKTRMILSNHDCAASVDDNLKQQLHGIVVGQPGK